MPFRFVEAKRVLIRRDRWVDTVERLALHGGLHLASLAVEPVELRSQWRGGALVRCKEAGNPDRHVGKPARRVEPGPHDEAKVVRACACRVAASRGEQR